MPLMVPNRGCRTAPPLPDAENPTKFLWLGRPLLPPVLKETRTMTPQDTLAKLDRLIESRSILRHPFYVAWERGELSRDQLATYAATYYPHVAAFPGYLEAALATADDPVVAEELRDNLADETSNPKPHPELWLDFAAGYVSVVDPS